MFQIRPGGTNNRAYRPGRDIAYLYQYMASTAMWRLGKDCWHQVIRDYAAHSGLNEQDLVKGGVAFAKFINLVNNPDIRSIGDAWDNSGMSALPDPVLMAIMFELGCAATKAFRETSREVSALGTSAPGAEHMVEVTEMVNHLLKSSTRTKTQRSKMGNVIADRIKKTTGIDPQAGPLPNA